MQRQRTAESTTTSRINLRVTCGKIENGSRIDYRTVDEQQEAGTDACDNTRRTYAKGRGKSRLQMADDVYSVLWFYMGACQRSESTRNDEKSVILAAVKIGYNYTDGTTKYVALADGVPTGFDD